MGTVFRKTATKPLPQGAEIYTRKGQRFARWRDAKGKKRTAELTIGKDGSERIIFKVGTYTAKYRDGSGVIREKATGCRDEAAARSVLGELERRAELVKAGVLTPAEDAISDHQGTSLAEHFEAYLTKLEADGTTVDHRGNVRRCLTRVAKDCRFLKLGDLDRDAFGRWLVSMARDDMGARTRNLHRASLVAFCNWCVQTDRLMDNPFAKVKKADEAADCRRKRRALTEEELKRLLDATRRRPLLDAMTVRHGPRKGRAVAKIRPEAQEHFEALGHERALIYKTAVLTGMRKRELTRLTVGKLNLDGKVAFAKLDAADEKSREGSQIVIRDDLVADLREWLEYKLGVLRAEARRVGESIPVRLPVETHVFRVPRDLVKIMDRDLRLAGIPKHDELGRTVDVHALRHTFGTHLSMGGVAPRTAQAAMRHSSIDLTMNTYTDTRLLDMGEAMEALPELPLNRGASKPGRVDGATGTENPFAPMFAPKADQPSKTGSTADKRPTNPQSQVAERPVDVSACPDKRNNPLTTAVNGLHQERETGFGPATSSLGS